MLWQKQVKSYQIIQFDHSFILSVYPLESDVCSKPKFEQVHQPSQHT